MGKRELLIALAFGAAILVAFQLTGGPSEGGPRRFSLATLLSRWRTEGNRDAGRATHASRGAIPADAGVEDIRVSSFSQTRLVGEARDDIAWELGVEAWGATESAARATAASVELVDDHLGNTIALRTRTPANVRTTATITIRVPHRLRVRAEDARELTVSGVAGVRLEGVVGDVTIRDVAGEVNGSHRNGTLRVEGAGSVELTLVSSRATIAGTREATSVTARNGETRLERPAGPVDLESSNESVTIVEAHDSVRVSATGGRVNIEQPRGRVDADSRRTNLRLTLDTPVPVTAVSRDAALGLELVGIVPVTIDALAIDNQIKADQRGPTPERRGRETTLHHVIGDKARVSLRNERGEIVIASR